jgi:hypothetical protein
MTGKQIAVLMLWASLCLPSAASAQDSKYKEYKTRSTRTRFFEIAFNKDNIEITAPDGDQEVFIDHQRRIVSMKDRTVYFGDTRMCDRDGVYINERRFPWEGIYDFRVSERNGYTVITFYKRSDESDRVNRTRRGNIIGFSGHVTVDDGDFVRGAIFSAVSDIRVDGEVNRDIVSLFGDIELGAESVVRGDIASITGDIEMAGEASVYGEVFGNKHKKRIRRRGRFYRHYDHNAVTGGLVYNRVDGAHPWLKYTYDKGGYNFPRIELEGGYAFASERWRFNVGIEQVILRDISLSLGGSFFRRLESEDRWLFSGRKRSVAENTFFALLVTEDFMDYFESDGGALYLKARPWHDLRVEARYHHEVSNWLEGHSHLWSIFGGNKLFSDNFSTVDSAYREAAIYEIDTTSNASLRFKADYDNRDDREPFAHSACAATAALEWSTPDLKSDFNYRRYTLSLRRYQQVNRRTFLLLRLMYGGSDGYLPMHKRFFVGGLGTLRGYYHKEYMGTQFWMGNAEYRFNFRRSALALSVIYDVAQIANDRKLDGTAEVKQSLGLAFYLGDDTRMSLARRLDRSTDITPKFYVRLSHVF